jgi:hypothetical protein
MNEARNEFNKKMEQFKYDNKLSDKYTCSKEEEQEYRRLLKQKESLPNGVYKAENGVYYKLQELTISKEERDEYLAYTQIALLGSIKRCLQFFVILAIIGIIGGIIIALI